MFQGGRRWMAPMAFPIIFPARCKFVVMTGRRAARDTPASASTATIPKSVGFRTINGSSHVLGWLLPEVPVTCDAGFASRIGWNPLERLALNFCVCLGSALILRAQG